MVTLIEHVENLSRFTPETREHILQAILYNNIVMDDENMFCYSIARMPWGNEITILYADGDGEKMWEKFKQVCIENDIDKIYCFSRRWKPICKKYNFKPMMVLCEREGFK